MRSPCRAHGVDADTPRSVFQRRTFGQAENAMLGRMIGAALSTANQPADRRAVDDGAASLLTHVLQLILHTGPHTTQVDRVHAVEVLGRGVGGLREDVLNAGIVECHIQAAECGDGLLDHRLNFAQIRHVAADTDGLVSGFDEFIGGGATAVAVHIRQRNSRARLRECLGGRQANARRGAGNQGDLVLEGDFHDVISFVGQKNLDRAAAIGLSTGLRPSATDSSRLRRDRAPLAARPECVRRI